jgi:D-glycero-alpha-D-manno-heptose-7-phosphate kinase
MIITRTPFRISFAGGGSDLRSFYSKRDGCVLSATINKYMYISVHPSFNRVETLIKYSRTEIAKDVLQLDHPIARQLLLDYGLGGVEITSTADIPSGSGLSTSSAYSVGLIHALNAFQGRFRPQTEIAAEACALEIDKLGDPIGKQDQYGVAMGGMKFIQFHQDESVSVTPVVVKREVLNQLENNLLLFYTGYLHSAGDILEEQNANVQNDAQKFQNLAKMTELAKQLRLALMDGDLGTFGEILHQGWMLKKGLASKISSPVIDAFYEKAIRSGAAGGKLLGAGGGGFLLFYCEKDRQEALREALRELDEFPFSFENCGTQVIYSESNA